MAKSTGEGGGTEATTLIFPTKKAWDDAAEAKAQAKKRSASANGTFSKVLARLVEEQHMDRRAARMVLALDAIEDDEDLHVTVFHLIDGMKKRGILTRAMAAPDMFDNPDTDALAGVAAKGVKGAKAKKAADAAAKAAGNVTSISEGRRTGEEAGAAQA